MSGLHDPDFFGWDTSPVIELDIDAIYREARQCKNWQLVYECDGAEFRWSGKANDQGAAEVKARSELADQYHAFSNRHAVLVVAIGE